MNVIDRLSYDPKTGKFYWLNGPRAGKEAGCRRKDGYILINLEGTLYLAHRLAWLFQTGSWPSDELDHIDGNPSNNSWKNLRLADRYINNQNTKAKGWTKIPSGYYARIFRYGKVINLGVFKTSDEAETAYKQARELYASNSDHR